MPIQFKLDPSTKPTVANPKAKPLGFDQISGEMEAIWRGKKFQVLVNDDIVRLEADYEFAYFFEEFLGFANWLQAGKAPKTFFFAVDTFKWQFSCTPLGTGMFEMTTEAMQASRGRSIDLQARLSRSQVFQSALPVLRTVRTGLQTHGFAFPEIDRVLRGA